MVFVLEQKELKARMSRHLHRIWTSYNVEILLYNVLLEGNAEEKGVRILKIFNLLLI